MTDVSQGADVAAGNVGQGEPLPSEIAQSGGLLSTANYSRKTMPSGHLPGKKHIWAVCLGTHPRGGDDGHHPA